MKRSLVLADGTTTFMVLQLALPILCMSILQCLSGSLNVFWVARYLGEGALAAVVNAQSIMSLLTGTAVGIAMAASILVGQCIGAGEVSRAKRIVSTGVCVFLVLSVAIGAAGVTFAQPLLSAMRTTGEPLEVGIPYARSLFLSLPIAYLHLFVTSLLLGTGDWRAALGFMSVSAALGAVLTPMFIFGGGVVQGVGIVGSALATLVSQSVSLGALTFCLYRHRHPLCLYKSEFVMTRSNWLVVGTLLSQGLPVGAQALVVSSGAVLMIALVNGFGVNTTAAYGALMQLWNYIQMPALAIAVAVSSITAQSVGAREWGRVRETARVGVVSCVLITGVVIILVYAADIYAYQMFLTKDSPAIRIATHINRIVLWSLIFSVIATVLFAAMRAGGAVLAPFVIQSLSLLVVRFPLALILVDRWQADAIWWSFSFSYMVDFVLGALYYRYGAWRSKGGARNQQAKGASERCAVRQH